MDEYRDDRRSRARGADRRRERRFGAKFNAHLILSAAFLDAAADVADMAPLSLYGHTHDLSPAGLALVLPLVDFDTRACSAGLPLRVRLDLPAGPVEVEAEAVHCKSLGGREPVEGVLVGARLRDDGAASALLAAGVYQEP